MLRITMPLKQEFLSTADDIYGVMRGHRALLRGAAYRMSDMSALKGDVAMRSA